jgi:predicted nicotinamide N-methyase
MSDLETVVLTLPVGDRSLEIEQIEKLTQLATASVRAGTDPYWAYLWPSARALVPIVADADLDGRSVLEIGAGLGAPGLAAAARGAIVTLTDNRRESLELIERNASRNGLEVRLLQMDWDDPPEALGTYDLILASDVLYDDGMLRGVLRFAKRTLTEQGEMWLSDPQRIPDAGIRGAALLSGFETESRPLVPGRTLTGGVNLHLLRRRKRRV